MDTVSMLNKMSFYCQPILPLVYDESMSYYETLCKVVGQLNTTGETVNKLNEGLTGEIADRQAADTALDARIKQIEETNRKIHFLKLDTIGNLLTPDVTRENLSQWIQDGDLIAMLYAPDELENSWAVATNYRCLGATGADSMQLSFYVPISVTNNAGKSGVDVAQEVVVISLPVGALTNQWTVRSITSTIPNTNADGFVNLTATVGDAGSVTCDVEPGAIIDVLRNYFSGTNQYAVAVNARLTYDGKQYHSASAIVKADASGSGNIRIEFENYYNGVRTENGVRQMNTETIFLVGDASTNVWSVEMLDHKTFDFSRYEGFQFTRGAHNVITNDDESTPNSVYAQYHSDTSGKIYQNLPVRLIDTVNNAEYWNGVFDIKDDRHMTFTFVTSNYVAASDKMIVRVIELSADVDTTTWNYAEKEFELPISSSGEKYLVESTAISAGEYDAVRKKTDYYLTFNKTNNEIIAALNSGKDIQFKVTLTEGNDSYTAYFSVGYTRVDVFSNVPVYMFVGSFGDLDHSVITVYGVSDSSETFRPYLTTTGGILPEPNPDDSDDGKVLAVNKHKWELKTPTAAPVDTAMSDTSTNAVQNKVIKKYVDDHSAAPVDTALSDTSTNPVQNKVVKEALDGKASTAVATRTANGLMSTSDYIKLLGIEDGATNTVVDASLNATSTNPVQNKVVKAALDGKASTAVATTSTNGLMSAGDKTKLGGVADGATRVIVDSAMSATSTNAVQNKVVKKYIDDHSAAPVDTAMSDTSTNAVQNKVIKKYVDDSVAGGGSSANAVLYTAQTLTYEQKFQARKNIEAADSVWPTITGGVSLCPEHITDSNDAAHVKTTRNGGDDYTVTIDGGPENQPVRVKGIRTPADADTDAAANVAYILSKGYLTLDTLPKYGGETA